MNLILAYITNAMWWEGSGRFLDRFHFLYRFSSSLTQQIYTRALCIDLRPFVSYYFKLRALCTSGTASFDLQI